MFRLAFALANKSAEFSQVKAWIPQRTVHCNRLPFFLIDTHQPDVNIRVGRIPNAKCDPRRSRGQQILDVPLAATAQQKAADQASGDAPLQSAVMFSVHLQDKAWDHFAMLQSLDDGTLAFLHRTTGGPKDGDERERNPIKRWWPDYITTPIPADPSPKTIAWNHRRGVPLVLKDHFARSSSPCVLRHQSLKTKCPMVRGDKQGLIKFNEQQGFRLSLRR